jgi:hypothetical protein
MGFQKGMTYIGLVVVVAAVAGYVFGMYVL